MGNTEAERWFARRTYRGRDWTPRQLLAAKGGRTISVVLPARNEAATVGSIVSTLRRELIDAVPVIDELIVIDSDSSDDTAQIADAAGAQVFRQTDILPAESNIPGKGEALWKSLAVTTGDVIAFIDSDLRDFSARFATGLLGPLLAVPGVEFVKGCYDRPLQDGATLLPAGGGRVTELVARPLLNLYWPPLAGFVQPLAGEYCGSRRLLERIPFVSGYGVEIAMLIDVLAEVGLDGMAQVDLGERRHRNSPDAALARMAAQIQLTVQARLRGTPARTGRPARLIQYMREGQTYLADTHEITVTERPPIISVPGYAPLAAGRIA